MRWMIPLFVALAALPALAQTATPEPTETTDERMTIVYATLEAFESQTVAFDYTVTAGELHLANLLTFIAFSLWAFFLFSVMVFFLVVRRR